MFHQYGIFSAEFGLEPRLFSEFDRAVIEATKLTQFAAYNNIELRIIGLSIGSTGDRASIGLLNTTITSKEVH